MSRALVALALLAAGLLPLGLEAEGYAIHVLTLALLFAALGQAWNIVGGLANQMSLGHAAFFGIGAYAATILQIRFGLSPWLGLGVALVLGGLAAALISLPTMRLRGHYFALATLACGEVMRVIANTAAPLTGGPAGISVPFGAEGVWMMRFEGGRPIYWLMLGALVVVTAIFEVIRRGALGYRLRAVRENIAAAEAIGVDTARVKLQAAMISGALTAALGVLYAQFNFFFDPDTVFGVASISVRIALMAIIGGIGTAAGPILGALIVIPLEEFANAALSDRAAGLSQLVYGAVLIAMVLVEPRGLMALRHFWQRRPRRASA
ncbi:branched-chain amino acid ABC transporter permease [Roseomonas sp. USHLN139]|uniref:branched-chain amino acid ABC transporter permease n=1 Tax=Roseomonas sp. USHLN139 TaxID=3081298 RepID=UPI003B024687